MARRPDSKDPPEAPVELHTSDVQILPDNLELTDPLPRRPFDPDLEFTDRSDVRPLGTPTVTETSAARPPPGPQTVTETSAARPPPGAPTLTETAGFSEAFRKAAHPPPPAREPEPRPLTESQLLPDADAFKPEARPAAPEPRRPPPPVTDSQLLPDVDAFKLDLRPAPAAKPPPPVEPPPPDPDDFGLAPHAPPLPTAPPEPPSPRQRKLESAPPRKVRPAPLAMDLEVTPKADSRSARRQAEPAGRAASPDQLFDNIAPRMSGAAPLPPDSMQVPLPEPPALDRAFLCVTHGPGAGTSVAIPEGEHPIGRALVCFLCLAHPTISREHALFLRRGNRFFIRDAGSQRGTRLNTRRVEGTVEVFPGDQIVLGAAVLTLRAGFVTDAGVTLPGMVDAPARRKPPGPTLLWVGAFATAIGSAALASVLLTPVGERLFRPPAAPGPAAAAPSVAAPAPTLPPLEAAPSDISLVSEIEVRAAPRRPSDPEPAPLPAVRNPPPRRPVARVTPAPTPTPTPRPTTPTASAAEALRLFSEGQIDEAIAEARSGGSTSVASKLTAFKREVGTAQADLSFQDGAGAIRHFSAAVAIDEELTRGWSKPGAQARNELTRLLVMAGERVLPKNPAQAVFLLEKALGYSPGHERALALLRTARQGQASESSEDPEAAPPKPKTARSAADEAFGD